MRSIGKTLQAKKIALERRGLLVVLTVCMPVHVRHRPSFGGSGTATGKCGGFARSVIAWCFKMSIQKNVLLVDWNGLFGTIGGMLRGRTHVTQLTNNSVGHSKTMESWLLLMVIVCFQMVGTSFGFFWMASVTGINSWSNLVTNTFSRNIPSSISPRSPDRIHQYPHWCFWPSSLGSCLPRVVQVSRYQRATYTVVPALEMAAAQATTRNTILPGTVQGLTCSHSTSNVKEVPTNTLEVWFAAWRKVVLFAALLQPAVQTQQVLQVIAPLACKSIGNLKCKCPGHQVLYLGLYSWSQAWWQQF